MNETHFRVDVDEDLRLSGLSVIVIINSSGQVSIGILTPRYITRCYPDKDNLDRNIQTRSNHTMRFIPNTSFRV